MFDPYKIKMIGNFISYVHVCNNALTNNVTIYQAI